MRLACPDSALPGKFGPDRYLLMNKFLLSLDRVSERPHFEVCNIKKFFVLKDGMNDPICLVVSIELVRTVQQNRQQLTLSVLIILQISLSVPEPV